MQIRNFDTFQTTFLMRYFKHKSPKLNIAGYNLKISLGEPGKDSCSGDGGSPLVCQAVSGRWHVIGLVSWGIGCGVEGRPAIYTNVFHYLDFIYEAKQILPLSSRLEPPLEQENRKWARNFKF